MSITYLHGTAKQNASRTRWIIRISGRIIRVRLLLIISNGAINMKADIFYSFDNCINSLNTHIGKSFVILGLASTTAIMCFLPGIGFAETAPKQSSVVNIAASSTVVNEVESWVYFAGSRMTSNRAEEMLEPSNMTLVDFDHCESAHYDCVALTAEKNNGNVFRYLLIDEPCYRISQTGVSQAVNREPGISSLSRNAESKRAGNRSAGTQTDKKPGDFCISGYKVVSRIKLDNIVSVTPDGHLVKLSQVVQDPAGDSWQDMTTLTMSNWIDDLVTPPSGAIEGWSYEVLDENGAIVESEISEWRAVAGSSNTSVSYESQCKARVDRIGMKNLWEQPAALMQAVCSVMVPAKVSVGPFDLEPNVCGSMDRLITSNKDSLSNALLDKCFSNPEEFLASDQPYKLLFKGEDVEQIQFKTPWALDGQVPQNCTSFTAHDVEVDMGGGLICSADVRYECGENTSGACECKEGAMASDMACTTGPLD